MTSRYSWLAPAQLWQLAAPLVPTAAARPQGGGTRRIDDESVFAAIVFIVVTGSSWRELPGTFEVSWQTAYRRFRQWADAGLWERLHRVVQDMGVGDLYAVWTEKLRAASAELVGKRLVLAGQAASGAGKASGQCLATCR